MKQGSVTAIVLIATASTLVHAASGDAYPTRPIRFIMPYAPGGSIDTAGRIVLQRLSERLGQAIVVDNRMGSGGSIGTETVARAAPDGYTLLMGGVGTMALGPNLQKNLGYDPIRDFTPVTNLASTPYILVAHPSVPANTIKELVALARSKPGWLNFASGGGTGSASHLAGELFHSLAKIQVVHVPYKGSSPAITDVLAGQAHYTFTGIPSIIQNVKAGKAKIIAVTSAQRTPALPDTPTIAEGGVPGYDMSPWFGILAPARTPQALVARLHAQITEVLKVTALRERFAQDGVDVNGTGPAEFRKYMITERERWGDIVKIAGIKPD
jgi:tripartite-type tricarboxylate transporter receptor subunit TctC